MSLKYTDKRIVSSILILLIIFVVLVFSPKTIKHTQNLPDSKVTTIVEQNTQTNNVKASIYSSSIATNIDKKIINSFKGSNPDGAVNFDANGMIVIDHDLKRLFDYYFTATGELSMAQIKDQLKLYSQGKLDSFQLTELMNLFDQYSQYLNAYDEFAERMSPDLTQAQRLALISDFRIEILGSDIANAFFAYEESYIAFVLSDSQTDDGHLSEQQMAWLESENNATQYLDTIQENNIFEESQSMNADEIYEYRVEQYGEQAAQRLTQLDTERDQWQQTLIDYNAQRQLIENNMSSMTLMQLHEQYTEQQVRRLSGLWRIKND